MTTEWIDEMRMQQELELRVKLLATMTDVCRRERNYKRTWDELYQRFEKATGQRLPRSRKLDWIDNAGLMVELYKIASAM